MAVCRIIDTGASPEQYEQVRTKLGLGENDAPPGGLMSKRMLVLEAGTGASEHLIRSLSAGDDDFTIVGGHWDHFFLKNSTVERRWLVPTPADPTYTATLHQLVTRECIDVILPNADDSVAVLSAGRRSE